MAAITAPWIKMSKSVTVTVNLSITAQYWILSQ